MLSRTSVQHSILFTVLVPFKEMVPGSTEAHGYFAFTAQNISFDQNSLLFITQLCSNIFELFVVCGVGALWKVIEKC